MATTHSSLPEQIDISDINIQWSPPHAPASSSDSPHRSSGSGRSSPMTLSRRGTSNSLISESSRNSYLNSNSFLACTSNRSRSPDTITQQQQQRFKRQSSMTDADGRNNINVDPYKILGVDRGATKEDIKTAYKRLALLSHPRRVGPKNETSSKDSFDDVLSIEESVREWHFIVIAASYETLSVSEHRKEYDIIFNRCQMGLADPKRKNFGKKRGFWRRFKKGLDISDSFDKGYQSKNQNETPKFCNANSGPPLSSFCGSSPTIRSGKIKHQSDTEIAIAQIQSSKNGKKLLLDCKPLLLSDDEASNRQKSTGTESIFTEDGNENTVREETHHLFGGPLAMLYKARQYQPFYDAFGLFRQEFGSDIFRSKSCFDDEDEDENVADTDHNYNISQQWVSGGTGRILNDSHLVPHINIDNQVDVSGLSFTYNNASPKSNEPKISLVHPVLPNIPLETLEQYGILDGTMKMIEAQKKPMVNNNNNNNNNIVNSPEMKVKVTRETKDGISSEVKTTTKVHGNKRIVRTQTTTIDPVSGKRKTVTSVQKENIQKEECSDAAATNDMHEKRNSFFELVPCCSYSLPPQTDINPNPQQNSTTKVQVRDDDPTISSSQSNSNFITISKTNFENKKELRQRMKNMVQQRRLRQQDPFNASSL